MSAASRLIGILFLDRFGLHQNLDFILDIVLVLHFLFFDVIRIAVDAVQPHLKKVIDLHIDRDSRRKCLSIDIGVIIVGETCCGSRNTLSYDQGVAFSGSGTLKTGIMF
jgi:hypothetical protein